MLWGGYKLFWYNLCRLYKFIIVMYCILYLMITIVMYYFGTALIFFVLVSSFNTLIDTLIECNHELIFAAHKNSLSIFMADAVLFTMFYSNLIGLRETDDAKCALFYTVQCTVPLTWWVWFVCIFESCWAACTIRSVCIFVFTCSLCNTQCNQCTSLRFLSM